MTTFRTRRRDLGTSRSRWLAQVFGRELRVARVAAGMTQRQLASVAGVSQRMVSRAERGSASVTLLARCRLAASTGHELGWRLHPVASVRLRDSGQLEMARAVLGQAHPSWRRQVEAPIATGDLRAVDLLLVRDDEVIQVELERVLVDFQAQLRSASLKRQALAERHAQPVRLVIAVRDTRTNRARLAVAREVVVTALPNPASAVWEGIRDGTPIGADGLVLVRSPRT